MVKSPECLSTYHASRYSKLQIALYHMRHLLLERDPFMAVILYCCFITALIGSRILVIGFQSLSKTSVDVVDTVSKRPLLSEHIQKNLAKAFKFPMHNMLLPYSVYLQHCIRLLTHQHKFITNKSITQTSPNFSRRIQVISVRYSCVPANSTPSNCVPILLGTLVIC